MYVYEYCLFFFFKQKTAYEMRISDWSSDVCSSDLPSPPSPSPRLSHEEGREVMYIKPNWLEWLEAITGGFLHGLGVMLAVGLVLLVFGLLKKDTPDA